MHHLCVHTKSLFEDLTKEYEQAKELKTKSKADPIDKELRTVRIFISSTFRDFHNERNLLVTRVFPRLREWCSQRGLYLVECDLRWGIPTYVSREETLITCFDEIERGRHECNDMNFFLGLLGDRYGWIPARDEITEYIKRRYNWIDDSSVTLMEFIHGMIRTLTPNGLIMIRSSDFIEELPENNRSDFRENDLKNKQRLKLFKKFLKNKFSSRGLVHFYKPHFDGIVYDKFIEKNRVLLKGLDKFATEVEDYFKNCITNNLLNVIDVETDLNNNDNFHALMVRGCRKQCLIRHKTFLELLSYLKNIHEMPLDSVNPIVILSGTAGIGKSTILAYCVKKLDSVADSETFFHSVASSSSSHYNKEIVERLYRFLSGKTMHLDSMDEMMIALMKIFTNGVENCDKKIYYVVFDGLDELSEKNNLRWLPLFTHRSIVIVIGTLMDNDPESFYLKLKTSEIKFKEIPIEPMEKDELCYIVSNYLEYFGKKLDPNQMNALMNFRNSHNPLWLISACEEMRIHGDYSTLLKLIESLPVDIFDLNRMIIKRLMKQDSTNLLRCFLTILITSRAGVWENIVRELLSSIMNYQEPVSNSTWLDIVRQLKGFLLIESIPLPLIKFRHRVMKQSIETELQLDNETKMSLHSKMADFFKSTADKVFVIDYFYHLIKSNSRNRIVEFMRNQKSWKLFSDASTRCQVSMSMRCQNHVSQTSNSDMVMCLVCSNQLGQLSISSINKNSCFYCGNVVSGVFSYEKLLTCVSHQIPITNMNNCVLCDMIVSLSECEHVKVCQFCKNKALPNQCGAIVKETDSMFDKMSQFEHSQLEPLI